ncbi:unnamed protein product [Cylicocyclus nassatus]|uniref:FACT complex subunit SPT16 N-terminal lobe domain-containing protein n=1 Tax=Cylicocyclus nassatus TaxID=53992 RepID=A0AA36H7Y8_CYLNA|nr:unnamed protein product [Cylicocyclus nassatus]
MPEKKILTADKDLFLRHATALYECWNAGSYGLGDVEGLMVMVGQDEGAVHYSKSKAKLLDTLMIFTKKGIYALASNRKADYFNSVKSDEFVGVVPPVTPIHRDKTCNDWQKASADVEKGADEERNLRRASLALTHQNNKFNLGAVPDDISGENSFFIYASK